MRHCNMRISHERSNKELVKSFAKEYEFELICTFNPRSQSPSLHDGLNKQYAEMVQSIINRLSKRLYI